MRGVLGGLVVLVSLVMWNENLGAPPVRAAQRLDQPAPTWTLHGRPDASTAPERAQTSPAQQRAGGDSSRARGGDGARTGEAGTSRRARGARPRREDETREAAGETPGVVARTAGRAPADVRAAEPGRARARRRGKVLTGTININTADARHLSLLPGIGPAMARRIIEARTRRPFRKPAHLRRVRGIGKKKYNKIKRFVVVKGESTLRVWSSGEVGR